MINEFEQALPWTTPSRTTFMLSLNKSTSLTASEQETFWSGRPNFALPSAYITGLFSTSFKRYDGHRAKMPTVQQTTQPGASRIKNVYVCYSLRRPIHHSRPFAGPKERGPKMDQDTVNNHGWLYARKSIAVREGFSVRSIIKRTTLR